MSSTGEFLRGLAGNGIAISNYRQLGYKLCLILGSRFFLFTLFSQFLKEEEGNREEKRNGEQCNSNSYVIAFLNPS